MLKYSMRHLIGHISSKASLAMSRFTRVLILGSFLALGIGGPAASDPAADMEQCRQCVMKTLSQSCRTFIEGTVTGAVGGAMTFTPFGFACGVVGGAIGGCAIAAMQADPCTAICQKAYQERNNLHLACPR